MNKLEQALEDHKQGKWAEAQAVYEEILQEEPENTDIMYLLATLQVSDKKLEEALKTIDKAILHNEKAPAYNQFKASVLARLGRNEEALKFVLKAVDENPNLYQSHILAGHLYYLAGNKKESEKHFNMAVKIDESKPEGHINNAKLLIEDGEVQQAINILRNIEQKDDNNIAVKLMLGQAFIENGAYNFAENYFQKVLAMQEKNELAGLYLGITKLFTGDMKNAETLISAFNQAHKNSREGLAAAGMLMYRKNDFQSAINLLTQAIGNGLAPNSWKEALVESYTKFGKFDTAIQFYKNKEEKKSDLNASFRLAELYEIQGNIAEAMQRYERIPQEHSKYIPSLLGITRCNLAQGKAEEAEKTSRKLLFKSANHAEATLLMLNALLLQDKKEEALELLRTREFVNYNPVYLKTFRIIHGLILDENKDYKQAGKIFEKNKEDKAQVIKNKKLYPEELEVVTNYKSNIGENKLRPVFILGSLSTGINQFINWLYQQGVYVLNDRMAGLGRTDILFSIIKVKDLTDVDDEMVNLERDIYFEKAKSIIPQLETSDIIADAMYFNSYQLPIFKKFFPDAKVIVLSRKEEDIEFHQAVFGEEPIAANRFKEVTNQVKDLDINYKKVNTDKWMDGDEDLLKDLSKIFGKELEAYKEKENKYWRRSLFAKGHWKKYK